MHIHSSYLHRMTALYAIQVLTESLDVEMLGKVRAGSQFGRGGSFFSLFSIPRIIGLSDFPIDPHLPLRLAGRPSRGATQEEGCGPPPAVPLGVA